MFGPCIDFIRLKDIELPKPLRVLEDGRGQTIHLGPSPDIPCTTPTQGAVQILAKHLSNQVILI